MHGLSAATLQWQGQRRGQCDWRADRASLCPGIATVAQRSRSYVHMTCPACRSVRDPKLLQVPWRCLLSAVVIALGVYCFLWVGNGLGSSVGVGLHALVLAVACTPYFQISTRVHQIT
ncbi:hypothetical protein BDV95DRAFT_90097 [Massariosphaeria phaeospora]|uniref:Uncharacterized protein n=1 Tax=Massariosphaeria phaeospora TaxID=100035 RepID=A0A7C8MCJ9_9PLEO|nr:hypothetical protein BDV95DRAFT_90097 [Massariosphaeria phaeospora]